MRELPTEENPAASESYFALKKVCSSFEALNSRQEQHNELLASGLLQILAGSSEQLTAAEKEVQVMTQLQHPNLLPLLAQAVVPDRSDGRMLQLVYMLFPVYEARAFSSSFLLDTQNWTPIELCVRVKPSGTLSCAFSSCLLALTSTHAIFATEKMPRPSVGTGRLFE